MIIDAGHTNLISTKESSVLKKSDSDDLNSIEHEVQCLRDLQSSDAIGVDIESSGVNIATDVPYGYSIAANQNSVYFVGMHNRFFSDIVADERRTKICHNAKFDRSMFKKSGIEINNLCDTIIAAHLLELPFVSLEDLSYSVLWNKVNHKPYTSYDRPIEKSTPQELSDFFCTHAIGPLLLWNKFQRDLRADNLWNCFWQVEMPLVPVLSDMELTGTYIDQAKLDELGLYYDGKISLLKEALDYHVYNATGIREINYNSPDQMAELLYNKLKVLKPPSWTYRNKKHPGVDKEHLEQFVNKIPIIALYLKYKAYLHLKSTYVTGIKKRLVNGRIHTNFNQTKTRTSRLSSSDPNLQNIPKRWSEGKQIRKAFAATPDGSDNIILKVDFDQMELRDFACWANCTPLIEAFNAGRDVHAETAIRVFGDIKKRPEAKTLHYQLIYGGGIAEHRNMFFTMYPEAGRWLAATHNNFRIFGYARTRYGRKRTLGNYNTMSVMECEHADREGVSTIVQGSCAEYVKLGMRKIWNETKNSDIKMILQVHDEVVFDMPRKYLNDVVELVYKHLTYRELQAPLTVTPEIGNNWGDTIEYDKYCENNGITRVDKEAYIK